jgi:hypothetical protein
MALITIKQGIIVRRLGRIPPSVASKAGPLCSEMGELNGQIVLTQYCEHPRPRDDDLRFLGSRYLMDAAVAKNNPSSLWTQLNQSMDVIRHSALVVLDNSCILRSPTPHQTRSPDPSEASSHHRDVNESGSQKEICYYVAWSGWLLQV